MPDAIRIAVPTEEVAGRLASVLHTCRVRVAGDEGAWFLEVECDREFNELLLKILDGANTYLAREPEAALRLEIEGRSYQLHPPSRDGGTSAAA